MPGLGGVESCLWGDRGIRYLVTENYVSVKSEWKQTNPQHGCMVSTFSQKGSQQYQLATTATVERR